MILSHVTVQKIQVYLQEIGIIHRKTRFFYPQCNGKIERFFQTCKNEATRKQSYINLEDLEKQIAAHITHYNQRRLHSSLGYVTPLDMLEGRQQTIFARRQEKLKMAREKQLRQRQQDESAIDSSIALTRTSRSQKWIIGQT